MFASHLKLDLGNLSLQVFRPKALVTSLTFCTYHMLMSQSFQLSLEGAHSDPLPTSPLHPSHHPHGLLPSSPPSFLQVLARLSLFLPLHLPTLLPGTFPPPPTPCLHNSPEPLSL